MVSTLVIPRLRVATHHHQHRHPRGVFGRKRHPPPHGRPHRSMPRIVLVAAIAIVVLEFLSRSSDRNFVLVTSLAVPDGGTRSAAGAAATRLPDWIQTAVDATSADHQTRAASSKLSSSKPTSLAARVRTRFVLIDTRHPGNVGSSARSLKTMGFSGLVVVAPKDSRVLGRKKCVDAASGAVDVLNHATLIAKDETNETDSRGGHGPELDRALRAAFGESPGAPVLVCATGMPVDMGRERGFSKQQRPCLEPRKFFGRLVGGLREEAERRHESSDGDDILLNLAVCFGNERHGMAPEDVDACDVVLGIPTHPSFGSLNLATAVQILAYDWRQALGGGFDDNEPS